jgi:hypothetical protein
MAQVYSLNAVGYINVNVPTGFSIIADQLYATNQQTAQSVNDIFGPTLLNGGLTTPDPYAGVVLYLWGNGGFQAALEVQQQTGAPFWSNPTEAYSTSFNPGQAAFIYNPNAAFTMTFVGQVPQGTVTNQLVSGFNLVSSVVPQTGALDSDLNLTPGIGDIVYVWGNGGYQAADEWEVNGGAPFWSLGSSPTNTVGAGLFYYNATISSTNNWVRTFNINN